MNPYWLTADSGKQVCVEAVDMTTAVHIAEKELGEPVHECHTLPYPAEPRVGPSSGCPSFCHQPEKCIDKRSCPRPMSCCD